MNQVHKRTAHHAQVIDINEAVNWNGVIGQNDVSCKAANGAVLAVYAYSVWACYNFSV